jgi:acyl carrier protein
MNLWPPFRPQDDLRYAGAGRTTQSSHLTPALTSRLKAPIRTSFEPPNASRRCRRDNGPPCKRLTLNLLVAINPATPLLKLTITRACVFSSYGLGSGMTREQISDFCIVSLANVLRVSTETIEADAVFNRLGLDSAMVVYLMMELEEKLDLELSPDDFYDYPTVNDLSRYLTERLAVRSAA